MTNADGTITSDGSIRGINDKTINSQNNFAPVVEVKATFTADNAGGTAARTPVFVIPGCGKIADQSLGAGVTYTGDFATYADFIQYLRHVGQQLRYIKVQTSDAANNFNQTVSIGQHRPNLKDNAPQDFQLVDYRENGAGTYTDYIKIDLGDGVLISPQVTLLLTSLFKNTNITFFLGISHWEASKVLVPVMQ